MKTLKLILLIISHLTIGILGGVAALKIDHEYRIRQLLEDSEEIRLARKEADMTQERAELNIKLARQKIYLQEKQNSLEYRQKNEQTRKSILETEQKQMELAQAERQTQLENKKAELEFNQRIVPEPDKRVITNRRRIGKVCDDKKCIYQVEVLEQTYDPIIKSWRISKQSMETETELLTANQAQ